VVVVLARNWWALALRGLVALFFGIAAFVWPGITLRVLVLLFGAYALVDGIFSIAAAVTATPKGVPWWALLVEGLAGIAVGVLTFAWPGITQLVLLYMIAAWALVTGVFEIVAAIRLRKEIRGEWALALAGVLSIILGVLLAIFPIEGLVGLAWTIGAYAIASGVILLALSFRLRKLALELLGAANWPSADQAAGFRRTPNAAR
jgi:uncharacterized membrane protein HdeD (DUF308 family)